MPFQIFAKNNLKITADANKKVVYFLDVTLDLNTGNFKPYSKPTTTPLYVHSQSNYPPNILTTIPEAINWRLSSTHTHTLATHKERFATTFWKGKSSSKGLNFNKK